ncbi:long-chain fatty acid--CoA ligase [Cyanobium sp. FGCU-52]|nr:long-chain fatty acid--CoA ligase [Cyanobium sp. FGCU52]
MNVPRGPALRPEVTALQGPPLSVPVRIEQPFLCGRERPGNPLALADPASSLGWRELEQATTALAATYRGLGLQRGDRLATLLPNQLELMVSDLACLQAGLVICPLNYRYAAPEIDHVLNLVQPALLLADPSRAPLLDACNWRGPHPPLMVEAGSGWRRLWAEPRGPATPSAPVPDAGQPHEAALIYFTSGTTGHPKAVTHTRSSLGVMLASQEQVLGLGTGDRLLVTSSMAHMSASMTGLAALLAGATLITPHSGASDELLQLLRRHRPTVMAILPPALMALIRDPRVAPTTWPACGW